MSDKFKILMLEDNTFDAKLNVRQLKKEKIDFEVLLVDDKKSFLKALREYKPEIILSDYSIPQFSGLDALEIVSNEYPEIPFIMVTGSLDEETAVICMKQGAWDYVIKDHIVRLGPAVRNAIERRNEILQKKEAELLLQESEKKFRDFVLLLPEVVFEADLDGNLTFVNENAYELFNMTKDYFQKGVNFMKMVAPHDLQRAISNLEGVINGNSIGSDEYLLLKCGGEEFPAMVHLTLNMKDNIPTGFSGILVDITERKKAEQKLVKSLHEKEILLKEVHHRVKNNMQIISSMMKLQVRHINNEEAKRHLMESHHRVHSMAMIHEKLYQSKDFEAINFDDYVRSLSAFIMSSYGSTTGRINLDINMEDVILNINTAIPCGLIINELITNTLKHAFPNKEGGSLYLNMKEISENRFRMEVCDTGIGLPENISLEKIESLGLQLIEALVNQLGGEMEFKNYQGLCFSMEFTQN